MAACEKQIEKHSTRQLAGRVLSLMISTDMRLLRSHPNILNPGRLGKGWKRISIPQLRKAGCNNDDIYVAVLFRLASGHRAEEDHALDIVSFYFF